MSVCLFIVSGRLRCGAFKTFCDCPYQSRKAGTFTCRSRRWVTFHLPKADDGGFSPVSKSANRILPAKTDKNPIPLTAIGKSPIQPAKIGKYQLSVSPSRDFRIGKSSIFACRNGEKFQKAAGAESRNANSRNPIFARICEKPTFACFFGGISDCPPENFRQAKKPICLFAADLSGPPGKDIHDKIFVVIFHHGDCGVFVSGIYDISVMSRRRNPTFDHSGGGVFRYAVYNGS